MGRKSTNDKFGLPIRIIRGSLQLASLGIHLNTRMKCAVIHRCKVLLFEAYVRHWQPLNETKQDNEIISSGINFRIMERLKF